MFSLFDGQGKKKVVKVDTSISIIIWILQEGIPIMVDVAGPLCFQGDYQVRYIYFEEDHEICFSQARDVELPPPEDGDILAIHDTGAYTMSMYCKWVSMMITLKVSIELLCSRFNSIRASPVYGYRRVGDDIQFTCFKLRETVEECLQFWGLEKENIFRVWKESVKKRK